MQDHTDAALESRMLHRLVFFTDAVFAIVLTLLVLELRPPEVRDAEGPTHAFMAMGPHFLAFSMSFGLIAIFWAAHMNSTRRLIHFDWPSAWVNLLFLFPICLIPFASAWFGAGPGDPFIWGVYCAVLTATSVGNVALVLVVSRGGGRLLDGGMTIARQVYRVVRAAVPGIAFGIGLILLTMRQYRLAHYCWLLIPLMFVAIEILLKPRARPTTAPGEAQPGKTPA